MRDRAALATAALCAAVFFCACAGAQPAADPLNIFFVVDRDGTHRVTLLDGERFEPLHRFALRGAIADEPQFTPDGRHAFVATRDGWVVKLDLRDFTTVAETRAATETQALALSSDGRFVAIANAAPPSLTILDAELRTLRRIAATDAAGRVSSPVTLVRNSRPRRSFVAALPELKELWEISYDPQAPEIAEGLVHDYKLREGAFVAGFLNPRRTPLEAAIEDFRLVPDGRQVVGAAREGDALHVVHLDVRRRIARVQVSGRPRLDWGTFWRSDGRQLFAAGHRIADGLTVIGVGEWVVLKRIEEGGRNGRLIAHPKNRLALLYPGVTDGERRGTPLAVLDLDRLEIVAQLRQPAGSLVTAVEFDRHGRHALVSVTGPEPATFVHDASTWRELKRLSLGEVVGKYNVINQIARHLN